MIIKHRIVPYLKHRNILKDVSTFDELLKIIKTEGIYAKNIAKDNFDKLPSNFIEKYKKEINDKIVNKYNTMTGDIFEFFTLCFLNYYGNYYKLHDVKPTSYFTSDDYGVDAYAIDSVDGFPITIQAKYRSDITGSLTYRELTSFTSASQSGRGDVNLKAPDFSHMILFTSCSGLHYTAKKEFSVNGSMRVFDHNVIKKDCDHDTNFWNFINSTIDDTFYEMTKIIKNDINLRDYQEIILNKFSNNITNTSHFKKQFILPTGAGKTIIQNEFINSSIDNGCKIFLTVAPTMMLVNQLGRSCDKNINYLCSSFIISSEGSTDDGIQKIENSTNMLDIVEKIIEANIFNIPIILSSTYKSFGKVVDSVYLLNKKIDLCILDEAQHAIKKDNYDVIKGALSKNLINNLLSFTATPKVHPADAHNENNIDISSMNNISVFGEKYVVTAKELTDKGFLTKPCMSFIELEGDSFSKIDKKSIKSIIVKFHELINNSTHNEVIKYTYDEIMSIMYSIHQHSIKIRSFKNNKIKCKIIISCSSVSRAHMLSCILNEVIKIIDLPIFEEDWYVDAISSDPLMMKTFTNDGSRDDILSNFTNSSVNGIMCHYNVLSEGIDIPSCTAVMLLRGMNDILICQTIGRTVRRTISDMKLHESIYDTPDYKNIWINDPHKWEKPYGHVIIPVYGDNENIKLIVDDILKKIFFDDQYIVGKLEVIQAGNSEYIDESERTSTSFIEETINEVMEKLNLPDIFKNKDFYYEDKNEVIKNIKKLPSMMNNDIRNIINLM